MTFEWKCKDLGSQVKTKTVGVAKSKDGEVMLRCKACARKTDDEFDLNEPDIKRKLQEGGY